MVWNRIFSFEKTEANLSENKKVLNYQNLTFHVIVKETGPQLLTLLSSSFSTLLMGSGVSVHLFLTLNLTLQIEDRFLRIGICQEGAVGTP